MGGGSALTEPRATYTLQSGIPRRFEVTVPGNPVPWERTGGSGKRRYKPKRTANYKALVRDYVALTWKSEPLNVAFGLTLRFYCETAHRCDLCDLEESVMGALRGTVYESNTQIWAKRIEKAVERDNPRLEILVEVL